MATALWFFVGINLFTAGCIFTAMVVDHFGGSLRTKHQPVPGFIPGTALAESQYHDDPSVSARQCAKR
jgi:hypothetical protein